MTALLALVADAEAQLSGPLHLLATAAAELPEDDPARRDLNAAASHINCALVRLARVESPGRGAGFSLPRRPDLPTFEVGVGPLYDALPAVNGSLARRAD